ncbi:MAG: MmgE/PrpD family protein [Nocardioidaceae bacterium]
MIESQGATGATATIAAFTVALSHSDLPTQVVHEAKRALVDHLAVSLAGSGEPAAERLRRVARRVAQSEQATIIGSAQRTSAPFAALLNAYSSHALDFDDTYNPSRTTIHGSSCVWPVVFALGELTGLSGRKALESFVVGFETGARVASAAGPDHYEIGWHVTGTAGHVAAAAAAAKALGLSVDATTNALGCGATQAAGLKELYGSDGKALHPAKAAMDGVVSGLLAEEGFSAGSTSLEGPRGLLRVMSSSPDDTLLVADLGSAWHLPQNGYKLYPSGSLTHPTVDALLRLRDQFDLVPSQVDAIVVRVHEYAATVTGNPAPTSGTEARFSLAHCAAVAVLSGRLGIDDFDDAVVNDPTVADLRGKVQVSIDGSLSKRAAQVAVRLTSGRTLEESVLDNRGTPDNPVSDDDLGRKFLDVAQSRLGEPAASAVLDLCWRIDEVDDVADLVTAAAVGAR